MKRPYRHCVLYVFRVAVACLVMAAPGLTHATERPTATLDYVRQGRTASECPDEATFRALVGAKLGYDPFAAGAASSLRVVLRRSGSDLSGTLTLSSGGTARGERTLHASGDGCDELAASLALAAAVAIDPDAAARGPAPAPAPVVSEPPAATPPPPPPPPPPAPREPTASTTPAPENARSALGPRFVGGVFIPWGLTPGVAPGARIGGGIDADSWLVMVEASSTLESSKSAPLGTVSAQLFDAALVPCFRPTLSAGVALALCAAGRIGMLRSNAEQVERAAPQTDLVGSLGPRAGLELLVSPSVGFGVEAEMPIAFSRVHLVIDDHGQQREVWASSRVGMVAAATVIFRPR
ncbi:MAG TPA: hypothetical protein VNN72_30555, partial [Polyangiaceae bacterium]|nr:hypothetical protein [Polyangiaceae bacterium]